MSFPYTPDGMTPPVSSITLPQDITNFVQVGTVNPPFQNLADNIAWQLLAQKNVVNAANYGVSPGATAADNATFFQLAIAALVAAGKGTLLVPPGAITVAATALDRPAGVHLMGVAGETTIILDDATANFNYISDGDATQQSVVYGIQFEGAQVNTGRVFYLQTGASEARLFLVQCGVNVDTDLLRGEISHAEIAPVVSINSRLNSMKTDAGEAIFGFSFEAFGGRLALAPAATDNMISAVTTLLQGVTLAHASTLGGVAFVKAPISGTARILGCLTDISGGSGTALVELFSSARVVTAGNLTIGTNPLYRYNTGPLAAGSSLQLNAEFSSNQVSATSYTIPDGVASVSLAFGAATPPGITLPHILSFGEEKDIAVMNNHGAGDWGADFIVFVAQGADEVRYNNTGLDGLADGEAITIRFRALVNPVSGNKVWTQIGATVRLS